MSGPRLPFLGKGNVKRMLALAKTVSYGSYREIYGTCGWEVDVEDCLKHGIDLTAAEKRAIEEYTATHGHGPCVTMVVTGRPRYGTSLASIASILRDLGVANVIKEQLLEWNAQYFDPNAHGNCFKGLRPGTLIRVDTILDACERDPEI